jgi:glycosyltransferase involved in cell wall biosynthesis
VKDGEGQLIKTDLDQFDLDYITVENNHAVLRLIWGVSKILRVKEFDIIHSQGFTAGVIAALGNVFSQVPHIITSHDVFRVDQFSDFLGRPRRWLLSNVLGMANFIQSVSDDAQQNLLDFLPNLRRKRKKLGVILNGIDIARFEPDMNILPGESFRERFKLEKNEILFGFLGRFMPQKGFEYLIDAVGILSEKQNSNIKFCILAVNDGAYIREYQNLIEKKGLSQYFNFTGFVHDVGNILFDLDAVVMPSLWEAYGLMAAEAFIAGCPVIASNCIGLREVIRDTPAIVVRERDSDSLARALKEFMENSKDYKQKAMDFVPEARKRFDSRVTAKQLDGLFNQVLVSKKSF